MSDIAAVRNKGVAVELDKPRILKFDLNSFAELEERYGSVEDAMLVLQSGTIKGIRTLLWCGLIHDDEQLTERQVGAMIGIGDLAELSEKLTDAMSTALPAVEVPPPMPTFPVEPLVTAVSTKPAVGKRKPSK